MEGELIADHQVWFGIREPEWWPEDEDDFEERVILPKNSLKMRVIKIRL